MTTRKIRVGVSGHDLKFWLPLQRRLEQTGLFEFRIDEWTNHDEHDREKSRDIIAWADVLMAEWALGNAVFYSRHKLPHQRLVIRLHLQERLTTFPAQIDYANVDHVVFVGPHILRECVDKFGIPESICSVVGNFVDIARYAQPKLPEAEFTLGMIGVVPARKRLDRALDVLEILAAKDERYMLRVKGPSPASYDWLWERESERAYYEEVFSRINGGPLRHKVIFDPAGDDVAEWLRLVGVLLSPSDFESFHMAVAEGTASGAVPIVWNWEGATEIYPSLRVVDDPAQAAEQIQWFVAGDLDASYRDALAADVRERYDEAAVVSRWQDLFAASPDRRFGRSVPLGGGARAGRRAGARHAKALRDMKVAVVCDEFTYNSFKYEFDALVLEPGNWKEVLEREKPDLFFCESAWSGVDSIARPWKGRVYASANFQKENRGELLGILEYCKRNGIPTVFWNKEDPSHYDDRIHDFVATAKLFDVVFTTDEGCVARYKAEHGLERVHCLPFATQPRIFNPIEKAGSRGRQVVFAGSWYANHLDRSATMETIFDSILASGYSLEIYDRFYGGTDPNHQYPERFRPFIRPAVPHALIDEVYKSSVFGLNMNTETKSESMFARRVFELMSCNTLCLSNYSRGMERMFGDAVVFVDAEPKVLASLAEADIERKRSKALRTVLREHTYKSRFKSILDAVRIPYSDPDSSLVVACVVDSMESADRSLAYFNRQAAGIPGAQLLLVVANTVPDVEVQRFYEAYNRLGAMVLSQSYLERYSDRPADVAGSGYVALVDYRKNVPQSHLADAFVHTAYVSDAAILMGSTDKYQFKGEAVVNDIIAPASYFVHLLRHHGALLRFSFYQV